MRKSLCVKKVSGKNFQLRTMTRFVTSPNITSFQGWSTLAALRDSNNARWKSGKSHLITFEPFVYSSALRIQT